MSPYPYEPDFFGYMALQFCRLGLVLAFMVWILSLLIRLFPPKP